MSGDKVEVIGQSASITFFPAVQHGGRDAVKAVLGVDLEGPPIGAVLLFPGFLETNYSTPDCRYFYKGSKDDALIGFGAFADVFEYVTL